MKIIFVRHGETDWNQQKKYQGSADIPLNEVGIQQAIDTATELHRHLQKGRQSVTAIYSSDLSRALKTAEILGVRFNIQHVERDQRLRELSFGSWEGRTFNEIFEHDYAEFNQWHQDPFSVHVPNGESLSEVFDRVMEAVNEIAIKHMHDTVLIVTHGGVIKALRAHFDKGFDLWGENVKLASAIECTYEQGNLRFD